MADTNVFYFSGKKQQSNGAPDRDELILELRTVISELNQAYLNFNAALESELIESCIYEINALQARYAYLLKAAKDSGIQNVDVFRFPKSNIQTNHLQAGDL